MDNRREEQKKKKKNHRWWTTTHLIKHTTQQQKPQYLKSHVGSAGRPAPDHLRGGSRFGTCLLNSVENMRIIQSGLLMAVATVFSLRGNWGGTGAQAQMTKCHSDVVHHMRAASVGQPWNWNHICNVNMEGGNTRTVELKGSHFYLDSFPNS